MILPTKTHTVSVLIDYSEQLKVEDEIISMSIDHAGINTLIIHSAPQYRTENGMFSVIRSDKPKDYTFIRHDLNGNEVLNAVIKDEYFNFHHVNFLPGNEILLICGRSRYQSETEIDRNARIYNSHGEFLRDYVAGDGIQDVKVDRNGEIWTSYFDEGIFGNYGWDDPIGSPGLICWNKEGKRVWEFEPVDGLDHMADCYAMNIDPDNNTWFYYYTEFPLVRLDTLKNMRSWETKISGSGSFNISGDSLLMADGYDGTDFVLFKIEGSKLKELKKIKFQGEDGAELNKRNHVAGFGSNIGFLCKNRIYLTDLSEIK